MVTPPEEIEKEADKQKIYRELLDIVKNIEKEKLRAVEEAMEDIMEELYGLSYRQQYDALIERKRKEFDQYLL